MSIRPFPPGWPCEITGLPILFIFVGAPQCWQHAKEQKKQGFYNHLCLPVPQQCHRFQWPVDSLTLIVIIFCDISCACEGRLVGELASWQPDEINIRHWPSTDVICHRKKRHE